MVAERVYYNKMDRFKRDKRRQGHDYANIKYCDIANGSGVRTSLFVSGCRPPL